MQNVEFKAELRDRTIALAVVRSLRATWVARVQQVDTYYRVPSGRLKKREQFGEPVEYIAYERPNKAKPKISRFEIYSEQQASERFGAQGLPVWLIVRKSREIFVLGHVRIHLDEVEGLGEFMELEAIVAPHHNLAKCHHEIERMRREFGPALGEAIDCSYADMLSAA